jgi:hypothetical protein
MKTLHTPAPWHVEQLGDAFIIETPGGISGCPYAHLARVHMMTTGVGKHNARLIAAAPLLLSEMLRYLPVLESLEKMATDWVPHTRGTGIATLNGYRNAIAKATGEPVTQ